jgi:hypothetical protein
MPNDPLPVPEDLAEPRDDVPSASEHGFLTHYISSELRPDETQKLARIVARLESALRDHSPAPMLDAFTRPLADLVAAIGQIENLLAASASSTPDVHFAVERIQDIAMALRQRDVEETLCDGLDAAIREVGDAIVRSDAANAGVVSAAALLRELTRHLGEIIARGDAVLADAAEHSDVSHAAAATDAERLDDTASRSVADSPAAHASDDCAIEATPESETDLPKSMLEMQATTGPQEDSGELLAPLSLPMPSPIEAGGQESQAPETTQPPPSDDANQISHAALNDPFAALQSLSEEELIALFS